MTDTVMTLTSKDVKKVAKLASLPIDSEEMEKLSIALSQTLHFLEKIKKVNTDGVAPTSHVTGLKNVFREDTIRPSLSQKQALSQSHSTHNGYFKVPAVLEE